jgi:hypothetical protein
MSGGPAEVPEIEAPSWLGQEFPRKGKLNEKLAQIGATLGDWSAKAADFADAAEMLGFLNLDAIGVTGTAVAQYRDSPVKRKWLRGLEAGIAGLLDFAMGQTPLGPLLPAADSAVSMVFGVSPGDLINNGLRAGITAAEGAFYSERQGQETLQAKALVGDYGKAMKGILGG